MKGDHKIPKTEHDSGLEHFRAASWSCANGITTERQPHLFYRAGDVDALIDDLNFRHAFELRRAAAIEAFLMKELGL